MVRTFRYPLLPNAAQAATFEAWRIACQGLYNGALEERRNAWRQQRRSVRYNDQTASLTVLRAEDPAWADIPVQVLRSPLRQLERAMQAFFRRVKVGEKPGYPRFRARDRYDSFGIGRARIDGERVYVPKLGPVRFNRYRPLRGKVLDVRVVRTTKRWMLCVSCDLGAAPAKVAVRSAVGIDVGLEAFATLSDGERVENPRFFREGAEALARRQQALARCKRGSNRRRRAKNQVARAYDHMRNHRIDFARKVAAVLVARFDMIAFEELRIGNMVRGNLAKSIYDAAWGQFLRALTCKAEEAGKWAVPVDPYGTSQRCAMCGATVSKALGERQHHCSSCGFEAHRDHNAALNILALGRSAVLAQAEVCN